MKPWTKIHLVAVSLAFAGCGSVPPAPNPAASRALKLSGVKDPVMALDFRLVYGNDNRDCDELHGAGGYRPRYQWDSASVPAGTAEFAVELPLNKYVPGHCNWQPQYVSLEVSAHGGRTPIYTLARFSAEAYFSFDEPWIMCRLGSGLRCDGFDKRRFALRRDGAEIRATFKLESSP